MLNGLNGRGLLNRKWFLANYKEEKGVFNVFFKGFNFVRSVVYWLCFQLPGLFAGGTRTIVD